MEQGGAERALTRMRRYTSASLAVVAGVFGVLAAIGAESVLMSIAVAIVGVLTVVMMLAWENPPPLWFSVTAVAASATVWTFSVFTRDTPLAALLLFLVAMVPISQLRRHRAVLAVTAAALGLLPVAIAWTAWTSADWFAYLIGAVSCAGAAAFLVFLNRYAWGLYLEIDSARQLAADLAVAQERYRFAADLHDIQGHTLHVLRLKTKLASRLIDSDPAAARVHLSEADSLIAETLANTRSLAFGNRTVTLASELANAKHLFDAAGIDFSVTGSPPVGAHEELFGLVVREATTNILRHAQSSRVNVELTPQRILVRNDGSPLTSRAPSGLARLAERFAATGGTLRTSSLGGIFSTEAETA